MNITIVFLFLMLACPFAAVVLQRVLVSRSTLAAQCAGYCIGFGFLLALGLLACLPQWQGTTVYWLLGLNTLNLLLCSLVLVVSFVVHRFSLRYMHGDKLYKRHFMLLSSLTLSAMLMILADNLFLFWVSWSFSNLSLVLLMIHKKEWHAAKNSGSLAFYTLASGSLCLLIAFILICLVNASPSLDYLTHHNSANESLIQTLSLSLIVIAALTQSGLFPFNRWLTSSLNSPTPVSALMHAGLVNGGGILIVKFAPLLIAQQGLLMILFLFGALSALLGTVWKLMQHDIKKMLACSTMAQMGFMMMQCGVGLFAAAIAHLCWHGLFKAYLFLSSGSAVAHKKPEALPTKVTPLLLVVSLCGGIAAMIAFAWVTNKPLSFSHASTFVLFFAFIAGAQLMLTWLRTHHSVFNVVPGLVLATFCGALYGFSIHLIEWLIPGITFIAAPSLVAMHWVVLVLFAVFWAAFNLDGYRKLSQSQFGCWLYMNLFNASQPDTKTVTALRRNYHY